MTKTQKALCLALSVVLVISVFAFSALAADQTAEFTVSASETQIEVGDTITVTVAVTTDYYAAATGVPIYYDAEVFEYVAGSLRAAEVFGGGGATFVSDNRAEPAGLLNVVIVPLDSYGAVSRHLSGTLLTFQLTAKAEGTSEIGLRAEDQKTESHIGGPLYCGAYASEDVTSAVTATGQTFILNNTTVTVGTAAEPELQLSENGVASGVIIDRTSYCANGNGFVYGIDAYSDADILDKLATPAGSIRVTANDTYGAYGTGAKIELLDASGGVKETYYYVKLGDVNGDGYVDFTDVSTVEGINSFTIFDFMAGDGSVASMAADVNGDNFIDFSDVTYLEGINSFTIFPTQAEIAAIIAANKGLS